MIPVPESAVARVRLGAPVTLAVTALHKSFHGTVARFSDRLDTDTRTMHVEVDVPNPQLEIMPGMYADASLVLATATNAVLAPVEAIDRTTTPPSVVTVGHDNRMPRARSRSASNRATASRSSSGLPEGDLVVIGSRAQLKAGDAVTPTIVAPAPVADGGR